MALSEKNMVVAKKHLSTADHLLTMTYPLVKDPKLLTAVLDNIWLSLQKSLDALLLAKRERKEIPPYQDDPESKLNMLKLRVVNMHEPLKEFADFIFEIKLLKSEIKKAPIEIKKNDDLVICDKNYEVKKLKAEDLKGKLGKLKICLDEVEGIINE